LGKLGPPKPKAKEECFRLAGKNKGGKDIKAQARLHAGGTQSSPQAMSAGDLKENKKPLLEATRKKRFVIFWWLCRHLNKFCLPSLHNDVM